jgi:hypothetical protein
MVLLDYSRIGCLSLFVKFCHDMKIGSILLAPRISRGHICRFRWRFGLAALQQFDITFDDAS